jgi:hypothetical protein
MADFGNVTWTDLVPLVDSYCANLSANANQTAGNASDNNSLIAFG